jgi:monofunctional chorismate mutase
MNNQTKESIEIEREKINQINKSLVKLLDKRFNVVLAIARLKQKNGIKIFQPTREKQILDKVSRLSKNPKFVLRIFKTIMNESKKFQMEQIQ